MTSWPRRLRAWYSANRRRMPWREEPSPYRTWISEIMLQQTQVATVIPYFERFLRRFPDVASLAAAPEPEVMRLWAGLGYYSRARNLRRAAAEIVERHGGRFPADFDAALALPGIGRYTAGAILSIAFGRPHPVVDGNVARVFARLFGLRRELKSAEAQALLWGLAERHLDRRHPGDWNQALMELGALVCVPESPRCGDCPVEGACEARRLGFEDRLPVPAKTKEPVELRWSCLWIERAGKVLLWRRAESERFLPGHWGLPERRQLRAAKAGARLGAVRHSITHHRITLEIHAGRLEGEPPTGARWTATGRLEELLVSSLWRKAAATASARGGHGVTSYRRRRRLSA